MNSHLFISFSQQYEMQLKIWVPEMYKSSGKDFKVWTTLAIWKLPRYGCYCLTVYRENVISISLALQAAEVQVYLTEVESDEKGSACVSFSQTNKLIVWPEVNYSSHVRFVLTLCMSLQVITNLIKAKYSIDHQRATTHFLRQSLPCWVFVTTWTVRAWMQSVHWTRPFFVLMRFIDTIEDHNFVNQ